MCVLFIINSFYPVSALLDVTENNGLVTDIIRAYKSIPYSVSTLSCI